MPEQRVLEQRMTNERAQQRRGATEETRAQARFGGRAQEPCIVGIDEQGLEFAECPTSGAFSRQPFPEEFEGEAAP